MESNISEVIDQVAPRGIEVDSYLKTHHQFQKMFLQAFQEALYLGQIFQNVSLNFLDALDHLWSHQMWWKPL